MSKSPTDPPTSPGQTPTSPSTGGKPWEHAKAGQGSGSDPLATRFVESISYDRRLYRHDIAGSLAHAAMLAKVNLITTDELHQIETGLRHIDSEITQQGDRWPGWKFELEDVHMCIEAALIEKIGDPGRKLHTGRSRNDQVALDLKLWVDDATTVMTRHLQALVAAFLGLAKRDGMIVMPAYTHLQRAQPIVVGGELLAWVEAMSRCERRLISIRTILPRNPLGSGAVAGSGLPLDRQAVADGLPSLGGPTSNAIDATANRDAALDFVYPLAMTAMTLSRWAEQWIIYCSSEFGFITLDDRYTTGSSMMPQKRNPDMLELIRGRCGNVYGNLMALLTICKGLPLAYNRDLQEDKRHVFAAFDTVRDCVDMATRIVSTVRFNEKRIAASLERGFLDATSLADYLVTKGVPFRTAHQVVGRLVRECETRGVEALAQLPLQDMQAIEPLITEDVSKWLGATNVVNRYQTYGNAGVSGFTEQLKVWERRMSVK